MSTTIFTAFLVYEIITNKELIEIFDWSIALFLIFAYTVTISVDYKRSRNV